MFLHRKILLKSFHELTDSGGCDEGASAHRAQGKDYGRELHGGVRGERNWKGR